MRSLKLLIISVVITNSCYNNCIYNELINIKKIPFRESEYVDDQIYNDIIHRDRKAIPYLIDAVTDTTKMKDPRLAPPYEHFMVGDIAYFLLIDIMNEKLDFFLPDYVKEEFCNEGIYAYFRFVQNFDNRKALQQKLVKYYN